MRLPCLSALCAAAALAPGCSDGGSDQRPATDAGSARDASSDGGPDAGTVAQKCKRRDPLRQPFFGDLHVHTALSLDANLQGTRLRPTDAYRFARGEEVGLPPYDAQDEPRRTLQLERPLDFVALSDHAEFLGLVTTCLTPGLAGYDSDVCAEYRSDPAGAFYAINIGLAAQPDVAGYSEPCTKENGYCNSAALSAWKEVQDAAEAAQDKSEECAFTTFVAYEWSASPGLQNLHRNVVFRNATVPDLPFSYFDGTHEEELWAALERDCTGAGTGCDALTIPHNSNLSAGLMFEPVDKDGKPIDAEYARTRAAFEPLVEIFQHKGASECLPSMGPDELCGFEVMPYNDLGAVTLGGEPDTLVPRDYVRHVLGEGLMLYDKLGVDPFVFGFVASTDTHLGIPGAVEEHSFTGHGGAGSNARDTLPEGLVDHHWLNPGGLAVLWAEDNSREALFEAMRRREAYGTSGPRIVLRFFGGYDLPTDLCGEKDFVARGYEDGVPMGGELPTSKGRAPRFAVWAMRDPGTAKHPGVALQRVQIIKGWLEAGEVKYAIVDVAGAANNGASVDLDTCTPEGKGQDELCSVWEDPDFDASEPAFYYARVLENPSCRWSTYTCRAANVDCTDPDALPEHLAGCCAGEPETQQERAWSSPIFHRVR